jgi:uncharacterized protein (TIGR02466 family)
MFNSNTEEILVVRISSTPICIKQLILNDQIKKSMKGFIKNEISKPGRVLSNVNGYQTNDIKHPTTNLFFNFLKSIIKKQSNIFIQEVFKIKKIIKLNNIWINVNSYKDYNSRHTHPNSLISGVFYCKVPKNSGAIHFSINNNAAPYLDEKNIIEHNEYNSMKHSISPNEFQLILFPSWLEHEVFPNMNKKEKRISISFNCS